MSTESEFNVCVSRNKFVFVAIILVGIDYKGW